MAIVAALTSMVTVPLFVTADEFLIGSGGWMPGAAPLVSNGLIPFAILVAGAAMFRALIGKYFAPTGKETVQTLFVLLFVAFLILTLTGIWFRGAGMSLVWPWLI
jgi:hypothetical protein